MLSWLFSHNVFWGLLSSLKGTAHQEALSSTGSSRLEAKDAPLRVLGDLFSVQAADPT